jgi:hypothetical protein
MQEYLINFDRKIQYILVKNRADESNIKWTTILEEIFLNEIPVKQFLTHVQLASCKEMKEVTQKLTEIEKRNLKESAILKRAQRTMKNVTQHFEKAVKEVARGEVLSKSSLLND